MREMTVNATPEQIEQVVDFVNEQLDTLGCSDEVRIDVDVAVDELLDNIVQYAYGPEAGTVTVCARGRGPFGGRHHVLGQWRALQSPC